jgi:hypothetical protein
MNHKPYGVYMTIPLQKLSFKPHLSGIINDFKTNLEFYLLVTFVWKFALLTSASNKLALCTCNVKVQWKKIVPKQKKEGMFVAICNKFKSGRHNLPLHPQQLEPKIALNSLRTKQEQSQRMHI